MKKLDKLVNWCACILCCLPWVAVVYAWVTTPPKNAFFIGSVVAVSAVALLLEGLILFAFVVLVVFFAFKDLKYVRNSFPKWAAFLACFALSFYCAMILNRYTGA